MDLHDLALPDPPGLAIAGVDEQPMEPGVEAVGVADGADVQPGGHQRLLDGIGRPVVAAQDQSRGSMQPIERLAASAVNASWSPLLARRTRSRCIGHPARGGPVAALTHHESGGNPVVPSSLSAPAPVRGKMERPRGEPYSYRMEAPDIPAFRGHLGHDASGPTSTGPRDPGLRPPRRRGGLSE